MSILSKKYLNLKVWYFIVIIGSMISIRPAYGFIVVSEVEGLVKIKSNIDDLSSDLISGSLIDINQSNSLEGKGIIKIICPKDGKITRIKSPGKIGRVCGNITTLGTDYRSSSSNDAPIIFFPQAGGTPTIDRIYWGSKNRGKFIIEIYEQLGDGSYKDEAFHSSKELEFQARQKQFITYQYRLPESVKKSLKKDNHYKVIVKDISANRTSEESAIPGGEYQIVKTKLPSSAPKIDSKSAAGTLAKALGYLAAGDAYASLIALDSASYPEIERYIDLVKANILRQSGYSLGFHSSLYLKTINNAIRKKDLVLARLACTSLQESEHEFDDFWQEELNRLKKNARTKRVCSI